MPPKQKLILRVGFALVLAINVWFALPSLHYAPYGPVGADVASVYEPSKDTTSPLVPIMNIAPPPADPFVDTGKKVTVYIRNDYRDERAEFVARVTLLVMLVGMVFYRGAGGKKAA